MLTVAVNAIGFAAAAAVAVAAGVHFQHVTGAVPPPQVRAAARLPLLPDLGVYEPTSPRSYSGVTEFSRLIRRSPNIAVYYSSWWEPFRVPFAQAAKAHHATPMVQIEPKDVSLASIAAGRYDPYVRAYARAVRSFRQPVILAFGHEMNATWYSWGFGHTPAADFVAAWRHIHQVFAAVGARNVRWLWTVNVVGPQANAIKGWWPGAEYVTWVGIDGHYFQPSIRFPALFGATLGQIRKLTSERVLIAESGIAPFVQINRITDLFAGAWAHGLLGVVWFDVKGHNLRIEHHPAAIAAFRQAVSKYFKPAVSGHPGTAASSHAARIHRATFRPRSSGRG